MTAQLIEPELVTLPDLVTAEPALIEAFRLASLDENPLHVNDVYARGTSFGESVVYGVLGTLIALAGLAPRPGRVPGRLTVRFPGPILRNREYERVVVEDGPERAVVQLLSGPQKLLEVSVDFVAGEPSWDGAYGCPSGRSQPRQLALSELVEGSPIEVRYRPDWASVRTLVTELGLYDRGFGVEQVAVLGWLSYLAGMEAPGEASLLADIAIEFSQQPQQIDDFHSQAEIVRVDANFRMLSLASSVRSPGLTAEAKVRVFHRPQAARSDVGLLRRLVPNGEPLAGRTALVIGASRGLGAAISQALALSGATVYAGFQHCVEDAAAMRDALAGQADRVRLLAGDAADPQWCLRTRDQILAERGSLDLLVLNACPPPTKLSLAPGSERTAADYIGRSLAMAHTPLTVFAGPVAQAGGSVIATSTSWVAKPESGWSAYVAVKSAVEGLLRAGAVEFKNASWAVLRPARLRTAFNATPMTAEAGAPVEPVAAEFVSRLTEPMAAGELHVLG